MLGLLASFLSGLVCDASASLSSDELITNGGFETGDVDGWNNVGSTNATVSGAANHTGSYSLLMGGYLAIILEQVLNGNSTAQAHGNLTCYFKVPSYPDIDPIPLDSVDPSLGISVYYSDGESEFRSINISTAEWFGYEFPINTTKRLSKIGFSSYSITDVYLDDVSLLGTRIYQGDLVVAGHEVFVIENNWFHINGSVLVEGNGTLILRNATLDFMSTGNGIFLRNPSQGHPRLFAEDSAIIGMRYSRHYSNSVLVFKNCSVSGFLHFYDRTNVTIIDSQMSRSLLARENSTVTVYNSTIESLGLTSHWTNASVSRLAPGLFESWSFWPNSSVTIAPGGQAPNVTLINATIQGWQLSFQGGSHAAVASSELEHLHANSEAMLTIVNTTADELELYNFAIAESLNATYTQIVLFDSTKSYLSWYLAVHVIDSDSQPIPLANVTATYENATLAQATLSNAQGWATLTLLEKMMNNTGTYAAGNYTVEAEYGVYSNSASAEVTGNTQIALQLPFLIPEYTSAVVLALLTTATFLVLALRRRSSVFLPQP
jgi:hypothetical protein